MSSIDSIWPALVENPIEMRSREYKRSAPWREIRHHVAKAALGMANLRDGGYIVVGVRTEDHRLVSDGMALEHLKTYDPDEVMAFPQKYARPRMELRCEIREHEERSYVVIRVEQFDDVPMICGKAHDSEDDDLRLRKDVIYARPPGMPQTRPATADDLREILNLATDTRLRAFVERVARHGPALTPLVRSDEARYAHEMELFEEGRAAKSISRLAHHRFRIRPRGYSAERLPEAYELLRVAESVSVALNGWSLPMVLPSRDDLHEVGPGFVGGRFADPDERECWRLYRSGQILDYFSFYEDSFADLLAQRSRFDVGSDPVTGFVEIRRLIAHCWGAVVLASRLCERTAADAMNLGLGLFNIEGRALAFSTELRNLGGRYVATVPRLGREWQLDAAQLAGQPADAAVDIAEWFLRHFKCDYPREVIASLRDEVARGKWR
jgi:hypothetical protein